MSSNAPSQQQSQPGPFRARAIQLSLTARDLPTSLAWYRDVMGFTVEQEYKREGGYAAAALSAGDVRILLNQDDGGRGWERVKGEGFSIQFTTDQDIDEVANRVREAGGTLDSEPADMPWGARVFRIRDPDGFRIVVSSPRA